MPPAGIKRAFQGGREMARKEMSPRQMRGTEQMSQSGLTKGSWGGVGGGIVQEEGGEKRMQNLKYLHREV